MGTNYYWYPSPQCEHCGREDKPIHVGKSSGGWVFALHVYPENYLSDKIKDLKGWQRLFDIGGSYIRDEYGKIIKRHDMMKIITKRKGLNKEKLRRHDLDSFCIKHGKGTWDLCVGQFS